MANTIQSRRRFGHMRRYLHDPKERRLANDWISDRAVSLQLQEVGATLDLFQGAPDPSLARRLFVSLCLLRQSSELEKWAVEQLESMVEFTPFRTWYLNILYDVRHSPASLPFCLSDQEFRYYARVMFGDTIGNLDGVYRPPHFYVALVEDVVGVAVGVAIARFLPFAIPEAGGAASVLSIAGARAEVGAAGGGLTAHLLPGGSWDAAKKDILWPRYEAEYRRRTGQ